MSSMLVGPVVGFEHCDGHSDGRSGLPSMRAASRTVSRSQWSVSLRGYTQLNCWPGTSGRSLGRHRGGCAGRRMCMAGDAWRVYRSGFAAYSIVLG